MSNVGIAHQFKIRQQKAQEHSNSLFGNYWEGLNLDLKNAVVKKADKNTAENIILEYEWLGTMSNTMYHYGIYFDDVCGGVVCYGKNCTANFNVSHEFGIEMDELLTLARGACVHWTPKGAASKLIAQSLQLVKKDWPKAKVVVAYSDTDAGEIGTVYQATNWYYIGKGAHKTFNLVHKKFDRKIDERMLHDLKNRWNCKRGEAKQKLLDEGWEVEFKAVKHKYIFILGSKKDRKEILKKISVYEYPKRDSGTPAGEVSGEKR